MRGSRGISARRHRPSQAEGSTASSLAIARLSLPHVLGLDLGNLLDGEIPLLLGHRIHHIAVEIETHRVLGRERLLIEVAVRVMM